LGNKTIYTYDSKGRLLSRADSEGNKTTYEYDPNGFLVKQIFPDNGEISYKVDNKGNISEVNNNGVVSKYYYDERGNIIKGVNPSGLVIETSYNFRNDPLEVSKEDGGKKLSMSLKYDLFGNLAEIKDPLGRMTAFKTARGIFNRMAEIKDPLGNTIEFKYDEFGNRISYTDRKGNSWQYEYDVLDRLTEVIDSKENKILAEYDSRGNIKTQINRDGLATHYLYDALNRIKEVKTEDRTIVKTDYDLAGNVVEVTDGEGNSTFYKYNSLGNVTEVKDSEGNVTQYSYDSSQRVSGITDGNGNTTYYAYNKTGNISSITNSLELKTVFKYDASGRLKEKILPDESLISFNYDGFGRMIEIQYPDDTVTYAYDAVDNILSVRNKTAEISYTYDALNRVAKEENSFNNKTVIYAYDKEDNRTSLALNNDYRVDYVYDELNWLTGIINNKEKTKYAYSPSGNTLSKVYPNNMEVDYYYDTYSQLDKIEVKDKKSKVIDYFDYAYDKTGNIVGEITPGFQKSYTYNKSYQLIQELVKTQNSTKTRQYSYDKAHNRISEIIDGKVINYTYNQANQLIKRGDTAYQYDKLGNLTSIKDSGFRIKEINYTYNARNFLTSASVNNEVIKYEYDAIGRRLSRNPATKHWRAGNTKYIYDGFTRIQEIEPKLIGQRKISYLHGRFMDELISRTASPSVYYYQDILNNVRGITDNQAVKIQDYRYSAFGEVEERGYKKQLGFIKKEIAQPFLFNGRPLDPETKLYYYRFRDYSATTGRFIQPDPLGQMPGPNIYAYVNNNPVNWVDPWGLLNIVIGGSGSFIANRNPEAPGSEWRSNEATVGVVINPGFGESRADIGIFGSVGRGGGFNIGADALVGFLKGQSVEGHAVNFNLVLGPVRFTVVWGEEGKGFQGIIAGLGPAVPVGFSVTESITGDLTVRELLDSGESKKK